MGLKNRFLDSLGFQSENDEDQYDEQEYEVEEEGTYEEEHKQSKRSFFQKPVESEEEYVESEASDSNMRIVLLQPNRFEEAQNIASYLLEGKVVVFDLQECDVDKAINIVNFVSGAIYALDGSIQKINNRGAIFVAVPNSVTMDNELGLDLADDYGINIADWVNKTHTKEELEN